MRHAEELHQVKIIKRPKSEGRQFFFQSKINDYSKLNLKTFVNGVPIYYFYCHGNLLLFFGIITFLNIVRKMPRP